MTVHRHCIHVLYFIDIPTVNPVYIEPVEGRVKRYFQKFMLKVSICFLCWTKFGVCVASFIHTCSSTANVYYFDIRTMHFKWKKLKYLPYMLSQLSHSLHKTNACLARGRHLLYKKNSVFQVSLYKGFTVHDNIFCLLLQMPQLLVLRIFSSCIA